MRGFIDWDDVWAAERPVFTERYRPPVHVMMPYPDGALVATFNPGPDPVMAPDPPVVVVHAGPPADHPETPTAAAFWDAVVADWFARQRGLIGEVPW